MDLELWNEILAAHDELSRVIERSFAEEGANVDLDALRRTLRIRLEELRVSLGATLSADEAIEVLVPFLFLFDERVLAQLSRISIGHELSYRLLQHDLFPAEDGGDVFYEKVNALLSRAEAPQILLEAYLFCLQAGFEGRLADDAEALEGIRKKLADRVKTSALPTAPRNESHYARATPIKQVVLITVAALVLIHVILFAISRTM